MKLVEAIERAKAEKPNAYNDDTLAKWISQIEKTAQVEIMGVDPADVVEYSWKKDGDVELLITEPYSECYVHYLKAMIDYNNKEFSSYNYNSQMFNSTYQAFAAWYKRKYGTTAVRKATRIRNYW